VNVAISYPLGSVPRMLGPRSTARGRALSATGAKWAIRTTRRHRPAARSWPGLAQVVGRDRVVQVDRRRAGEEALAAAGQLDEGVGVEVGAAVLVALPLLDQQVAVGV